MFCMDIKKLHDQVNYFWYVWKHAWLSTSTIILSSVYQFGIVFFCYSWQKRCSTNWIKLLHNCYLRRLFNPQCQLFVANFDDSRPHWYRSGTVINQLFPDFRGIRNRGKDVWQILEFNPIVFWYMTGETAEAMVEKVYLDVTAPRHLPHTPKTDKRRRCILDAPNRALLVIIWLRQYLKLHVLAHMCQISKGTVGEEIIYHIVPVLILNFRHYMNHMT